MCWLRRWMDEKKCDSRSILQRLPRRGSLLLGDVSAIKKNLRFKWIIRWQQCCLTSRGSPLGFSGFRISLIWRSGSAISLISEARDPGFPLHEARDPGIPSLEARDSGFKAKSGRVSGLDLRCNAKSPSGLRDCTNFGSGLRDWRTLLWNIATSLIP